MGTKARVGLSCHKDIVLNGYGGTRQRFSAEGILGRERLQRMLIFRLRCHNFEPNRPVGVVVKHIRYRRGRFWIRFLGQYRPLAQLLSAQFVGAEGLEFDSRDGQNRHSVANGSPPLRRFCVTQALRDGPQ